MVHVTETQKMSEETCARCASFSRGNHAAVPVGRDSDGLDACAAGGRHGHAGAAGWASATAVEHCHSAAYTLG